MSNSILVSTKKNLGIAADYTAFDDDVIMHINSVLATLNQLGVGAAGGFEITNSTAQWEDFLGTDKRLNSARTYVFLKTRLIFDPPTTSFLISAVEKQIEELEWRLNTFRESLYYTPPTTSGPDEETDNVIFDGGAP